MKRILCQVQVEANGLQEIVQTGLRVFAGLAMALAHGLGKIPPAEGFVSRIGEMGFPMPLVFAWSASLAEVVGAVLVAVGLFTRPAALTLVITMAVAAFVAHGDDPFQKKEMALLYLAIFAVFAVKGAGRISLDYFISKK